MASFSGIENDDAGEEEEEEEEEKQEREKNRRSVLRQQQFVLWQFTITICKLQLTGTDKTSI